MFISKINYATERGNVGQNNFKRSSSVGSLPLGMHPRMRAADSVSFGAIDPITLVAIEAAGEKLFKHVKIGKAKNLILSHFYNDNIVTGLEATIKLNEKVGSTATCDLFHSFGDFLNTASYYATKLSDDKYENRDIKRKFLESVFLRENVIHPSPTSLVSFKKDAIPPNAKTLFKNLNNSLYGEFKQLVISKAVLTKRVMIEDTDSLLDGTGASNSFKKQVKSVVDEECEKYEAVNRESDSYWDNYHPGCSG